MNPLQIIGLVADLIEIGLFIYLLYNIKKIVDLGYLKYGELIVIKGL